MGRKILDLHGEGKPRVCDLERDEKGEPYLEFKKAKGKFLKLYLDDLNYRLQTAKEESKMF